MASHTTTVTLDAQLHERIARLKEHVSLLLRFNERSLGLGPMLGLLLDHWEQTPPAMEWLTAQAALYPKRGRPRRSEPADMEPKIALRKTHAKGHELIYRKRDHGSKWRIYYCRNCNMQWSTWDSREAPAACPSVLGFSSLYSPKVWTKNDLLVAGFEADEVEWAADEQQEQPAPGGGVEDRSSGSPHRDTGKPSEGSSPSTRG